MALNITHTKIILNNELIRINNKTVHFENYIDAVVLFCRDQRFDLDNLRSYHQIERKVAKKYNFFISSGLRCAVLIELKKISKTFTAIDNACILQTAEKQLIDAKTCKN